MSRPTKDTTGSSPVASPAARARGSMNLGEAFVTSLANLAGHKLRAMLTMLGVIFGVGAVIAMLSIGAGAEQQALELIDRLGTRNILIRSRAFKDDDLREIRKKSLGLSTRDCEAIVDSVPGVELVAPKAQLDPYMVLSASGTTEATLLGVGDGHATLVNLDLQEGRFLDAYDVREHAQVAIIGPAIRRDLFGYRPALGQELKVDDVWFTVIGVLGTSGSEVDSFQGVALGSSANAIYVPVTTVLRKLDRDLLQAPLSEVVVRLRRGAAEGGGSQVAARVIDRLLEQLHSGADDYELIVPEALLEQSRSTQRLFNLVMGSIAGISLLVGGIGIMNIMLASVLERTREIGVRRAVGARRRDIVTQFLVESFTISALGGVLGIVMGVGIAQVIAASAGWPTIVTPWSILLSTGVAVVVGIGSGLYPAKRAAELDPIESLRYE